MKKCIGILMVASPFILMFIIMCIAQGFVPVAMFSLCVAAVLAVIWKGVGLIWG